MGVSGVTAKQEQQQCVGEGVSSEILHGKEGRRGQRTEGDAEKSRHKSDARKLMALSDDYFFCLLFMRCTRFAMEK